MAAVVVGGLALVLGERGCSKKAIWVPLELSEGNSALPVYDRLGARYVQVLLECPAIAPRRPA
jgi:hypothetical protein